MKFYKQSIIGIAISVGCAGICFADTPQPKVADLFKLPTTAPSPPAPPAPISTGPDYSHGIPVNDSTSVGGKIIPGGGVITIGKKF